MCMRLQSQEAPDQYAESLCLICRELHCICRVKKRGLSFKTLIRHKICNECEMKVHKKSIKIIFSTRRRDNELLDII